MSSEKTIPDETFTLPFPGHGPAIPGGYIEDEVGQEKWGVVVDHLTAKEKERCEIWKDEVTNILIFAGLFSGVVTAFIIESYRSLQIDPQEIFLSRITASLEYVANTTAGVPAVLPVVAPVTALPNSANKLVNALWFMSLILSLSSALIGLVALQWLREHLRPSTRNVPLRTLPALIQMQADSLDVYYVPQIFTALPVLLISAIVLFFIGMIDFLWNINHVVAYPSIITISLLLAFILYTSIRPGLQGLPRISFGKTHTSPTVPCPYRSPQSWAFLQATFLISSNLSFVNRHLHIPIRTGLVQNAPMAIKDWIDWAISWPRQRDIDHIRSAGDRHSLLQPFCDHKLVFPPVYDTVRALTRVKKDFSQMGDRNFLASIDNVNYAFVDFIDFDRGSQGFNGQLADYAHSVLNEPLLPLTLPRDHLSEAPHDIKMNHARLLFNLSGVTNLNDLAATMSESLTKQTLNIVRFSCDHLDQELHISTPWLGPMAIIWHNATIYAFGAGEGALEAEEEAITKLVECTDQIFWYASEHDDVQIHPNTIGTSPYVKTLLHGIANILVHRSRPDVGVSRFTTSEHKKLLITLNNSLRPVGIPNAYLFLLASIYAHFVLVEMPSAFCNDAVYKRSKAFNAVATSLMQSHAALLHDPQLLALQRNIFPASLEAQFVWAYLDPRYDQNDDNDKDSSGSDDSDKRDEDGDEREDNEGDKDSDQEKDEHEQIDDDDRSGGLDRPRQKSKAQRRKRDSRKERKRTRNTVLPKDTLASKPCLHKPTLGPGLTNSEPLSVDMSCDQVPQQSLSLGPWLAYNVGPDNKMTKLPLVVNPTDEFRCKGDVIVDMDMAKMPGSTLPHHIFGAPHPIR